MIRSDVPEKGNGAMASDQASLKIEPQPVRVPATARDFLANERTFLAYMRTALAFFGFGFVIARFSLLSREMVTGRPPDAGGTHVSVVLGVVMAIGGVLLAAYGTKRYVDQDTALRRSEIRALAPRAALLVAGGVVIFGAFVAVALYRMR